MKYVCAALFAALFVLGWLYRWEVSSHADTKASLAVAQAVNAGLSKTIADMEMARYRENAIIEASAHEADKLTAEARTLERRLKEALRNAKTLDLDAPLPADAALALCLRYRAARGLGDQCAEGTPAGCADAGKDYPTAAFCDAWRRVTLRDALEWLGLLLDHAGAERIDKAALRKWAQPPAGGAK